MDLERPAAPDVVPDEPEAPRGPWAFARAALEGGSALESWVFMGVWVVWALVPSFVWARHLQAKAGWSALSAYWGERVSARDVWELLENGDVMRDPTGTMAPGVALLGLAGVLWVGWWLQARSVGRRPTFGAWFLGLLDALLLAALPLAALVHAIHGALEALAETGIQGLGWAALVGRPWIAMTALSLFLVQWWMCRLARAVHGDPWGRWSSWTALFCHWKDCFLGLWSHPVQWGVLSFAGVGLRWGLAGAVWLVGWRWGGGTPARVLALALLQALTAALTAWITGWMLRLTARYWRADDGVRREIRRLERVAAGRPALEG